ncbi:MAG: hypothetical protein SGI89_00830 [bacterium]|nr:hypothetical protein [bacterium]
MFTIITLPLLYNFLSGFTLLPELGKESKDVKMARISRSSVFYERSYYYEINS